MEKNNVQTICRDLSKLAPFVVLRLTAALDECCEQGLEIGVFETYRSPERQDWLYAQGRTRKGVKVTRATGWQSWHQYGVALDLAFKWNGKWQWNKDDPWDKVHAIFKKHGFETLDFEKAHVQITNGMSVKKAFEISNKQGLLALWSIIESGCKPAK